MKNPQALENLMWHFQLALCVYLTTEQAEGQESVSPFCIHFI